jgi:hypothetical protein
VKIIECVQLSPEWWEARMGIPTSSRMSRIITPKTGKLSAACDDLIDELIAEKLDPHPGAMTEKPMNAAMRHGVDTEPEARRFYAMHTGADVRQVGFCLSDCGRYGSSPDGLIGEDGVLEMKIPLLKTHVGYLRKNELPAEYAPQVHTHLLVTGRAYCDFMSYAGLTVDPLIVRVTPNEYTRNLRIALEVFLERYQAAIDKLMARAGK